MSKKFIVLDVEGYSNCCPYDVGFLVADKDGKIYEEYSVAIMPTIWENITKFFEYNTYSKMISANEMVHKNITEILSDKDNKYIKCFDTNKFFNFFVGIIAKHNIKRVWAYNCSFDKGALNRLFGENFPTIDNMVTFCDIIPAILHTKLLNKDYVKFCKNNNYITEKGNIQTKAEIVYRYLTGITNFTEEHTGLADVKIELEILLTAMAESKHPKYKPCQAWRILKEFCEVNSIDIPVRNITEEFCKENGISME